MLPFKLHNCAIGVLSIVRYTGCPSNYRSYGLDAQLLLSLCVTEMCSLLKTNLQENLILGLRNINLQNQSLLYSLKTFTVLLLTVIKLLVLVAMLLVCQSRNE